MDFISKRKPRNRCGFWVFDVLEIIQIIPWRTLLYMRRDKKSELR
jgi:hypothetical protein